jgi:hypothetical protein
MAEILTPRCPLCGHLPVMMLGGGTQAFCGNDDGCPLICWDPSLSLDANLLDAGFVKLTREDDDG